MRIATDDDADRAEVRINVDRRQRPGVADDELDDPEQPAAETLGKCAKNLPGVTRS
jgi:hypothetical protein